MLKALTTLSALAVALVIAFSVLAEDKAPAAPAAPAPKEIKDPKAAAAEEKPKFHLSTPIVKEMRTVDNFIYGETESSFETMMEDLGKVFFPLMEKNGKDGIIYDYPPIFVYQGVRGHDPKAKFKLQTGFPAREDTKAVAPFKTRQLEGHRCVSIYYTGPLMHLESAYKTLFAEVAKAGHKPTGEIRELYLYWEGEDSANTVVEIQVSIAKAGDNKDEKKPEK